MLMDSNLDAIAEITASVLSKKKYRHIHPDLIRSLAGSELEKGRGKKETLKAVTGKLHQVGAAYFPSRPDYSSWLSDLQHLPANLDSPEVKSFCREVMENHHSTRERLLILEAFFNKALSPIAPVKSILDLACGLNPLALPWMPAAGDVRYSGCDIFSDMVGFLTGFAKHFSIDADFSVCNLLEANFTGEFQVAFLLKTLPCLEQLQADFSGRLLDAVPAEYLLISFPVRSLSGRPKGMRESYASRFEEMMNRRSWEFNKYEFFDELAYLVKKK